MEPGGRLLADLPSGSFVGIEAIYRDFLLGRIRSAYSRIDLLARSIDVRFLSNSCALAIFAYATDCDLRDTGEPFGIAGLETQVYNLTSQGWRLSHVHYSLDKAGS